jgi:hypothetical protein
MAMGTRPSIYGCPVGGPQKVTGNAVLDHDLSGRRRLRQGTADGRGPARFSNPLKQRYNRPPPASAPVRGSEQHYLYYK